MSNENSFSEKNLQQIEEENVNFIKDIKGFYNKIHNEISSLKTIILDQSKTNGNTPVAMRKHMLSEKVP